MNRLAHQVKFWHIGLYLFASLALMKTCGGDLEDLPGQEPTVLVQPVIVQ